MRICTTHHDACDCQQSYYDALKKERDALAAQVKSLESELAEQARLHGMGSEREARLMARLEAAQNFVKAAQKVVEAARIWRRHDDCLRDPAPVYQCEELDEALDAYDAAKEGK